MELSTVYFTIIFRYSNNKIIFFFKCNMNFFWST